MRSTILGLFAFAIFAGGATPAAGVWFDSTVNYIRRGEQRNVDWPWPYICPDRVAAREPFSIMIRNGWRRQNLLGNHHFHPTTRELTTAGELKVQWIMTQAPTNFRKIYVERSLDPSITQQRIATARQYATKVSFGKAKPEVFDTHLISEGRPAATVDAINVGFQENMPPPVLPEPDDGFLN